MAEMVFRDRGAVHDALTSGSHARDRAPRRRAPEATRQSESRWSRPCGWAWWQARAPAASPNGGSHAAWPQDYAARQQQSASRNVQGQHHRAARQGSGLASIACSMPGLARPCWSKRARGLTVRPVRRGQAWSDVRPQPGSRYGPCDSSSAKTSSFRRRSLASTNLRNVRSSSSPNPSIRARSPRARSSRRRSGHVYRTQRLGRCSASSEHPFAPRNTQPAWSPAGTRRWRERVPAALSDATSSGVNRRLVTPPQQCPPSHRPCGRG